MRDRLWSVAAVVAIGTALALYTFGLGDAPAYLNLDEAHFANHAYSLATTGRDLNGSRLPLFVSLEDPLGDRPVVAWATSWYHPIGFYAIAAVLTVAPLTEWAIRLPIALIGVLNIVLIYLVAMRWRRDRHIAFVACALFAMTPAHFILSRMALDYLLPLPFALAWLLALGWLRDAPTRRRAIVTGVILGLGCFSYVSSWLMMPAYLVVTAFLLWKDLRRPDLIAALAAGFVAPLLLLVPWVAMHPDMPGNVLSQYQAGETRRSLVTAILTATDVPATMRTTLAAYWSYFNPSFLFVTGGASRLVSTGAIGVWPAGLAVLLLLAVGRMVRGTWTVWEGVLLVGVLLAPLPASLKGEPFAIQRATSLLPFGVLLATQALAAIGTRSTVERWLVTAALLSVPVQFTGFVNDYFGDYRVRSASALDPTAFRDSATALLHLIEQTQPPAIAIEAPLYDISAKWRYYATARQQSAWLTKTRYFSGRLGELSTAPRGVIAVVASESLRAHEGWQVVATPRALFGKAPLTILQRR